MSELYKRIETLCTARGTNITEMCRASGAPRGSLTDLKMGRTETLTVKTLSKIASYFDVSVGYLLGTEAEKAPTPVSESGQHINIVKIAGRDGSYKEKRLTDEQVKALQAIIDQMLEAPKDL